MRAGIWIVFRKELVYTLRDRKTLIFMLLIPTLVIPLFTYVGSRILLRAIQERGVTVVKIAADAQTQAAYRQLVHDWFLGTDMAVGVRLATSPIMKALVRPEELGALGDLSPEVLTDPAAFERWTHRMVRLVREGLDAPEGRTEGPMVVLPKAVQEQVVAYYRVVIKGLGLVEFVDPDALPVAPLNFESPTLPEDVGSLPYARALAWGIKGGSIQGYLEIPAGVETLEQEVQRVLEVTCLHDSTNDLSQEAYWRVATVIGETGSELVRKRLGARGLTEALIYPLVMTAGADLATQAERRLARIGGVLPLFVFIFTLVGAMYPAIDLGAGEKERYTLETLLLSPLSRADIALGKSLVILLASLVAAFLSLASVALSIGYLLPEQVYRTLDIHIDAGTALAAALLTVPPAVSFTGILLAISIYARSFKEAQNYMTALLYLLVIPPLAAMIPGLEVNWKLAFVPLVNVSLLARDFLRGQTHWGYYAATLGSCLALAAVCIAYAIRQFRREEVLFRS